MDPLLSGALIALVSAAAGFLGNYMLEGRRQSREDRRQREAWEREDRTRHHQERLGAYRNMIAVTSEEKFGFSYDEEEVGYWLADEVLVETVKSIGACHSEVLLLTSSERVREASDSINRRALGLQIKKGSLKAFAPLDHKEVDDETRPLLEARSEFLAAVREELGIDPETV